MFETSGWPVFSIADIEVSVSFWYVAIMGFILFLNPSIGGLLLVLAITISVLIHEFGHAVVCKRYRLGPSILLHGFGGLCMHRPSDSDWKDIFIVVAGPLIEIVFGVAALVALPFVANPYLALFTQYFAWVSIVWGLANLLLPLWPLDGGKLLHLVLRRFVEERKAQDWALKTSVTVAIPVGIAGFYFQHYFIIFLAVFIIMGNINTLSAGTQLIDRKAKIRASDFTRENLRMAEEAFDEEDWREAARLCHVIRSGHGQIPPKMLDRIWEILGISTARMGEHEEALGWLKRAPDTGSVREARELCEEQLEKAEQQ